MTRTELAVIAGVIRDTREHFKSHTDHAEFAAIMTEHLAWTLMGDEEAKFDKAEWFRLCKPTWIVGTSKENPWDHREADITREIRKAQ